MIRKLLDLIEKTGMKLSDKSRHDAAVLALTEQAAMKNKDIILENCDRENGSGSIRAADSMETKK